MANPIPPIPPTGSLGRCRARTASLSAAVAAALAASTPAAAFTLMDMQVRSVLNQPLVAEVPFRLEPGEALSERCVSVVPPVDAMFPPILGATIQVDRAGRVIRILGGQPVVEPISTVALSVQCPNAPRLTKVYEVLVDPYQSQYEAAPRSPRAAVGPGPVYVATAGRSGTPRRVVERSAADNAIDAGGTYLVQVGDTLSTIAFRVRQRAPDTTWEWARRIHAANLRAFIDGNPDRIMAGARLTIPGMASSVSVPDVTESRPLRPVQTPAGAKSRKAATTRSVASDTVVEGPRDALPWEPAGAGLGPVELIEEPAGDVRSPAKQQTLRDPSVLQPRDTASVRRETVDPAAEAHSPRQASHPEALGSMLSSALVGAGTFLLLLLGSRALGALPRRGVPRSARSPAGSERSVTRDARPVFRYDGQIEVQQGTADEWERMLGAHPGSATADPGSSRADTSPPRYLEYDVIEPEPELTRASVHEPAAISETVEYEPIQETRLVDSLVDELTARLPAATGTGQSEDETTVHTARLEALDSDGAPDFDMELLERTFIEEWNSKESDTVRLAFDSVRSVDKGNAVPPSKGDSAPAGGKSEQATTRPRKRAARR